MRITHKEKPAFDVMVQEAKESLVVLKKALAMTEETSVRISASRAMLELMDYHTERLGMDDVVTLGLKSAIATVEVVLVKAANVKVRPPRKKYGSNTTRAASV